MSHVVRVRVAGSPELILDLEVGDELETVSSGDHRLPPWTVQPLPVEADDHALGAERWEVVVGGWRFEVGVEDAARAILRERATRSGEASGASPAQILRAAIPGRIVSVDVAAGQVVEAGQRLLTIEAMKMENEIRAARAGTVRRVAVAPDAAVERGQELVVIG